MATSHVPWKQWEFCRLRATARRTPRRVWEILPVNYRRRADPQNWGISENDYLFIARINLFYATRIQWSSRPRTKGSRKRAGSVVTRTLVNHSRTSDPEASGHREGVKKNNNPPGRRFVRDQWSSISFRKRFPAVTPARATVTALCSKCLLCIP